MIRRNKLEQLIAAGDLREIFVGHLGWDEAAAPPVNIAFMVAEQQHNFRVAAAAQKRGFVVCRAQCAQMPRRAVRLRLQSKLMRHHYEHLLAVRADNGETAWLYADKPPDKPARVVEVPAAAAPAEIINKLAGLVFTMDEEDSLYIGDVAGRVRGAFAQNAERVPRRFYGEFSKELKEFTRFINGLQDAVQKEHYASLMLNRLMFIYFIQKKGYLDGNADYLSDRLAKVKQQRGQDRFYSFYRAFLKALFHRLADPAAANAPADALIGKVPYLNGGLFDEHQLEKENEINIADEAFEKLFAFFNKYQWYLDDRRQAGANEINPDVIGYIFEKYINDRAKMGAYYTKEDITGYIARNAILPAVLQKAREKCREAFDPHSGTIWKLLRENPERYIYDAAKHGHEKPNAEMPAAIRPGLDETAPGLLARRANWNKEADKKFALPGETWPNLWARKLAGSGLLMC